MLVGLATGRLLVSLFLFGWWLDIVCTELLGVFVASVAVVCSGAIACCLFGGGAMGSLGLVLRSHMRLPLLDSLFCWSFVSSFLFWFASFEGGVLCFASAWVVDCWSRFVVGIDEGLP